MVIRLSRVGKKNSPAYRVVVAEKSRAVKRQYLEILGHYNPTRQPKELVIGKERALFWLGRGAKPSDTVRNLMADLDLVKEKINKRYARAKAEEGAPAGGAEGPPATRLSSSKSGEAGLRPKAELAEEPAETAVEEPGE